MAYHYYQVNVGAALGTGVNVTTSPSPTEPIALRVLDAQTGLTGNKQELLRGLEVIRHYIETHDAPA